MICIICFCEENNTISCLNNTCTAHTCHNCFKTYLKFMANDNVLPKCPAENCKAPYLYQHIKKTKNDMLVRNYEKACLNYLNIMFKGDVEKLAEKEQYIINIRQKNDKYLAEYPRAIKKIIDIALKTKQNKLEKNIIKHKFDITTNTKKCLNVMCNGMLNTEGKCMICNTQFCNKCEQIKLNDHLCKQEDIDSVEFVSSLVSCPECNLKVIRSYGCNFITCANCQTNFNYINGTRTLAGNHHNIQINLHKHNIENNILQYYTDPEFIQILQQLIAKLVPPYTISAETFLKYETRPDILSKRYDKMLQYSIQTKKLQELHKLHDKNELTIHDLINLMDSI